MEFDELALKANSLFRKAGISNLPTPVLLGTCILGIALICLAAWHFWPRPSDSFAVSSISSAQASSTSSTQAEPGASQSAIVVDVEGEVSNPGLYELEDGSRVGDAVKAAGGFTQDAASGTVNLAQKLKDGEQVSIPSASAQAAHTNEMVTSSASAQSSANGKVNINTANAEELQKLSGIGPSLSERIIDYRTANGLFSSIEELQKVSGIGETRFKNLKDKICV